MPNHKPEKAIRIRGHHLLCLLTYKGEGYTKDFISNFNHICEKVNAKNDIELVAGPDDICAGLKVGDCGQGHCRSPSILNRDQAALMDVSAALGQTLAAGQTLTLTPSRIRSLRAVFAANDIRSACRGCEWFDLCTSVAQGGFKDALLIGSENK